MISRYELISAEEILARTKMQLRLLDASNDDFLEVLICEALDSMNASSMHGKFQCKIKVQDCTAKLPKGLTRLLAVKIPCAPEPTTNDTILNNLVKNSNDVLIYGDTTFLNNCGCDSLAISSHRGMYQINNGFIHFNSSPGVSEVEIAWLGLLLDKHGRKIIYQRYERALMNYACYMFADAYKENYTEGQIMRWMRTFQSQKQKIGAEDTMYDFSNDKYEISLLMNALMTSRLTLLQP